MGDHVAEFLQDGVELLRVLVDVLDLLVEPLLVDAVVGGQPAAGPEFRLTGCCIGGETS